MSKIPDQVLLLPGESGWEIWTGQTATGYALNRATEAQHPSEIDNLPGGELLLFFPVKSITAIPMRVTSDDEALFNDLSTLHAERLGMRPDMMAGQITDTFTIAREPENTALLAVHLRPPSDEDLPNHSPKGFDISARAFQFQGDQLALWKELGRWVFAISYQGHLVYCQITSASGSFPDESVTREVKLALIQLSLQGMEVKPTKASIWTATEGANLAALSSAFGIPVSIAPRPTPVVPVPLSKLLPEDVRAARKDAQRRQNIILGIAAIALIYLGLIGWFGYGLWKESAETKRLTTQAEGFAPQGQAYAEHIKRWDELEYAIDAKNSPVDILNRIARAIPLNSGLRLRVADVSATEIALTGEAVQLEAVNKFSLALTKNNDLAQYEWSTPEPTQRERGWEFQFKAVLPGAQIKP